MQSATVVYTLWYGRPFKTNYFEYMQITEKEASTTTVELNKKESGDVNWKL